VSPVPGSRLVSPENNVVLRPGRPILPGELRAFAISVTGSISGPHSGRLQLSDDWRTLIFEPDQPYAHGEEVTVEFGNDPGRGPGGRDDRPDRGDRDGHGLARLRFDFFVSPIDPTSQADLGARQSAADIPGLVDDEGAPAEPENPLLKLPPLSSQTAATRVAAGELAALTVPPGYPTLYLLDSDASVPGLVFSSPFSPIGADPGVLLVVDDYAMPLFYRRLVMPSTDFKRQPNGRLTYYLPRTASNPRPQFYALNHKYAVVDSFAGGNGYLADAHDLQLLPNGHALLLCYDPEPVRMDSIVPVGRPSAIVTGAIVQELDRSHRVVFQWRSWDHYKITDMVSQDIPFNSLNIDWVHANSIEPDRDGNLLLSSRHLNEITKIDRRTGEMLWRFGPHAVNNQFTVIGDPQGFSHQHDVRRIANGHLTVFDNGNFVATQSRAVEYALDERNKTATLVWSFQHTPPILTTFMGNVQRLPDGGTMIGWGGATTFPKMTQLRPDQSTNFELAYSRGNIWTYRAFRFPWRTTRIAVDRDSLLFASSGMPGGVARDVVVRNPGPDPLVLNSVDVAGDPGFAVVPVAPETLAAGQSTTVRVEFLATGPGDYHGKLYVASVSSTDLIAQDVALTGVVADPALVRRSAGDALAQDDATSLQFSASFQNPVRDDVAMLRYSLPRAAQVTLEVFGVRGRREQSLVDGVQSAGEHLVEWRPEALPSGVYFLRLVAGDETLTRKIALIR
jgi:hypothetical protein